MKIESICQYYLDHIDSLSETLPLAMGLNQLINKSALEKFEEFEREHIVYEKDGDEELMLIESDFVHKFKRIEKRVKNTNIAQRLVPRSFIVSLVSQYDTLIGHIVSTLYKTKPELVSSSEKELTFKELSNFKDIDEAKDHIITKEVEALLRKSHADQITWLSSKFGIKIEPDKELWANFIEITERRNLFVHTDGKVSNQYLNVCKDHGCSLKGEIIVGNELGVPQAYYEKACDTFSEMGIKIAQVLWRKIIPSEIELADKQLVNYTFYLLQDDKYELSYKMCHFGTDVLKNIQSEEMKRFIVINKCLALKWGGKDYECKSLINSLDWSGYKDEFHLAVAVINDDFDKSYELMKKIGSESEMFSESSFRQWPLFKGIRKEEKFKLVFEEIFGHSFTEYTTKEVSDETKHIQENFNENLNIES